jgi:iron complex transport system ATP-binding protein
MTNIAISFSRLGFRYAPGPWILRGYEGAIATGRVTALLGPNGRGKTTLLKLLTQLIAPVEGRVTINGEIAFVPQLFDTSFSYTAIEMVLMGRTKKIGLFAQPSRRDFELALSALDRFGISDLAQRPFHEMSGGQRQLVIFARAIVAQASILILDEPTSALDLKNQIAILDWMTKLSAVDGLTVVFSTHHPHHALAIADYALLMMGTDKFHFGPAAEVLTENNLTSLYETTLKRIAFVYNDQLIETLTPILPRNVSSSE